MEVVSYVYNTLNKWDGIWNKYIGIERMSISISLIGSDGIVVATDSLRSSLNPRNIQQDYAQKLWLWNDAIAIMTVGSNTRYSDWITERFSKTKLGNMSDFEGIVDAFSKYAKEDLLSHTIDKDKEPEPENIMIFVMAGYGIAGDAKIVQLDSSRPNMLFIPKPIESPHVLSYDAIADYWLRKLDYKIWDTTRLMRLAVFLINESIKLGGGMVGGNIQLAIIKSDKKLTRMIDTNITEQIRTEIDKCINIGDIDRILRLG